MSLLSNVVIAALAAVGVGSCVAIVRNERAETKRHAEESAAVKAKGERLDKSITASEARIKEMLDCLYGHRPYCVWPRQTETAERPASHLAGSVDRFLKRRQFVEEARRRAAQQ